LMPAAFLFIPLTLLPVAACHLSSWRARQMYLSKYYSESLSDVQKNLQGSHHWKDPNLRRRLISKRVSGGL
jgi:hypothetical protein